MRLTECSAMTLGSILTCDQINCDPMFQVKEDALKVLEEKREMFGLVASLAGPIDQVSAGFKTGSSVDYNAYKNVAALSENQRTDFYEHHLCDIIKVSKKK